MSTLSTRRLGRNGPYVRALGFGTMGLSAFYGDTDTDEERFKVFDRALELGQTFWDTSDAYGDSEILIGKWLQKTGRRDSLFLATKFGYTTDGVGNSIIRSDPDHVKNACKSSLARLGVSKINLYYCHRVDQQTPIEHTVTAMAELKAQGLVDYLGLSEVSADTIRRAHKIHPISAVQIEYSPFSLDIENEKTNVLTTCRELGIAIVAYSPLGRGMLTGKYSSRQDFLDGDMRRFAPRFSDENFPKNIELVNALSAFARKKDVTVGQLVLSWLLNQGSDIIPIPGTKKIRYLEENFEALNVHLSAQEVKDIRQIIQGAEVYGNRYAPEFARALFADTPKLDL